MTAACRQWQVHQNRTWT